MLKDNEFRVSVNNLNFEDTDELIRGLLKYIDKEEVRVKFLRIRKGDHSFFTTFVPIFPNLTGGIVSLIITYLEKKGLKDRVKELEGVVAKKDEEIIRLSKNYEKLVDILDRAINPQMHSPFVTTTIEINNYIIKMRNNMVIDVIPRYSEDKKDFGDDNLRDHKKENRSLDKKNYKKCPYCSTKNDIDAKYCKECGMKPEKWDYSE